MFDNKEYKRKYYVLNKEKFAESSRNSGLKTRYGITTEQKKEIWESQERKCTLRGCDLPDFDSRRVHLEHCHRTGNKRNSLPCL